MYALNDLIVFLLLIISQCYKISELGRLRPLVSFTHKMISPDLKDLFQSVESALYVPEDTEQFSFAAKMLKAVHSEEIVSEIKLLSYRLDFIDCFKVFGKFDRNFKHIFSLYLGSIPME